MPPVPTLLIADDEADIRDLLSKLFATEPYRLVFTETGAEALTLAAEVFPDAILLDVMMPHPDGLEVCRRLRADPRLSRVPIVLITGLADDTTRLAGLEAGADDFIVKPFNPIELLARVRTMLRFNRYRQLYEEHAQLEIEHQQAEATLRESERFSRATLDALTAHVAILDEAGTILHVNHAWRTFALENGLLLPEDGVGSNYLAVCDAAGPGSEPAANFARGIRAVLRGERDRYEQEYDCHAPHEQRWFIGRVTRFQEPGPIRIVVAHNDITERKLIQAALQESERQLRQLNADLEQRVVDRTAELSARSAELQQSEALYHSILTASPDGISVTGMDGRIQTVSPATVAMLGAAGEADILGRPLSDFLASEDRERARTNIQLQLQGKRVGPGEYHAVRLDGSQFDIEMNGEAIRDANGQPVSLVYIVRNITERKQTEIARHESEARYRELFDNINSGVAVYQVLDDGRDFIFKDFNRAGERIDNDRRERLLGRSIFEMRPGVEKFGLIDVFRRVWQTGETASYPTQLYQDERLTRWYENFVYRLPSGEIVTVFDDVTERKRAETALHESEARFKAMFTNHSAVMLLIHPLTGAILEANPAAEAFYGYSRPQLTQLSIDAINAMPPAEVKAMRECAQRKERDYFVFPHRLASGEIRTVEVRSSPVEIAGQTVLFSIIHDITERQRAEEALRQSEQRLLEAQAIAHVGNWELNLADRSMWASEEAFRIYGLEHATPFLPLPRIQACAHPDDRPVLDRALRDFIQHGQDYNIEFRIFRENDHTLRVIHSRASLVTDAAGTPQKVLGVVQDITDREQAEDAIRQLNAELEQRVSERTAELSAANANLQRANRLKDDFLATMSHELRTPLTAILGLTESLQSKYPGPLTDKQQQYVQVIHQSGEHLLALITDVLDVAKISAGQLKLTTGPVSVADTCQMALKSIKPLADKKQIILSLALDPAVTALQADERRLRQILVNLLGNGVKFTPEGGQVGLVVSGDAHQRRVNFTAWDTGIGIATEDLPRLFQDFVQLDARLARNYEGTGLGLALVRRLVELHGGQVKAESDGPGKGSRLTVSLPWEPEAAASQARAEPEQPTDAAMAASGAATGSAAPLIMVVADQPALLLAVQGILTANAYRVETIQDSATALARAQALHPALMLVDIQMLQRDGLELIRQIRTDAALASMPLIALMTLALPGDRERCLAAGASDFLSKPVKLNDLLRAISALLPSK